MSSNCGNEQITHGGYTLKSYSAVKQNGLLIDISIRRDTKNIAQP